MKAARACGWGRSRRVSTASNRALCLLALLAGLACRSSNPSMGELRQALAAGEAARAKVAPAKTLQREIAFAGPPVAHAGEQRRRQAQALLELLAPELLPAEQTPTPSAASDASIDAATDSATATSPAGGPATAAVAESTTDAETRAATGAVATAAPDSAASAATESVTGVPTAVATGETTGAVTNALTGAPASAQVAAPTAATPEAQASDLPLALALREQTIGSGRLLALGPAGGRRVLVRAAQSQRAELEPRLLQGFQRLAAALETLGSGPLSFELALYLGPVDAIARAALGAQPCSAEFVLALSAEQRPAGAVPLLVRGRDPGLLQPLEPDSGASARFIEAAGGPSSRASSEPSANAGLASAAGTEGQTAPGVDSSDSAALTASTEPLDANSGADQLGRSNGADPSSIGDGTELSGIGSGANRLSAGKGTELLGDCNGAALWLRQAWLDLFVPLGALASGEVAVDPALCFGPSLVTAAPTVGFCWGPHGELADDTALGLDPRRAESAALVAVFLAAWSLADPDSAEFKRALDSLNAERELRSESARSAGAERLESEWLVALEGARSWLRRTCFDLPQDDARSVLLAAPAADSAK